MPPAKDLYFFDRYYDRGINWYLKHFAGAGPQHKIVGEVCQDYLFGAEAPQRILSSLGPQVRMMVTLRDPAERAWSSYLYMLKQGETPGSFQQALVSRPELVDHGRYGAHLERFVDVFGRDALFVGVFDDFQADPQAYVDRLHSWLGISPVVLSPAQLEARLPAAAARSVVLARAARWAANVVRDRDGANLVGRVKRSRLVQSVLYRELSDGRRQMSRSDREAVMDALAHDVEGLDRAFGLDLARRWGWTRA